MVQIFLFSMQNLLADALQWPHERRCRTVLVLAQTLVAISAAFIMALAWICPSLRPAANSEPVSAVFKKAFSWFHSILSNRDVYSGCNYRCLMSRCAWAAFRRSRLPNFLLQIPYPTATPRSDASLSAAANVSALPKSVFWDRIARKYAADPIADMAGYEATLQRVQALLSIDHEVLEIGCGTGSTALRLAPGTRRLMATDVSTGMIAIAREKLAVQPVPQLSFAVADADAAVFGKKAYDAVLAFNLLHLVDDLDRTIAVAARSLKPGGLFISKTACISEMNPLVTQLALPLMRAIGKAPHVLCLGGDRLHSAIAHQGLEILSVERHGTRGKDIRVFIVARKAPSDLLALLTLRSSLQPRPH